MTRIIIRLRWSAQGWYLSHGSRVIARYPRGTTKNAAEKAARSIARSTHASSGRPVQLLIFTRQHAIGRGGRHEASYGCDSKRRKG